MTEKMILPSKIISEEELEERELLMEGILNGIPRDEIEYFIAIQRLRYLNGKHMDAVLFVTAYN